MIENKYGVTTIKDYPRAKCFCPIGQDWYTNQFKVEIAPGKVIPDYCELDRFVKKEIDGRHMIIEEAVAKLYNHIKEQYSPASLKVLSTVNDAAHSTVTVEKQ